MKAIGTLTLEQVTQNDTVLTIVISDAGFHMEAAVLTFNQECLIIDHYHIPDYHCAIYDSENTCRVT